MMTFLRIVLLALSLASPLRAQGLGAGFGLGTLGVTGDVSYQVSPAWSVRMLAGSASISRSGALDENDIVAEYRGTLKLGGIGPVIDYHPFANGWRLSGGALLSKYRADLRFTGDVTIDGDEIENADVSARVRSRHSVMPKLAVGYSGASLFGSGLGVSLDAGVLYSGGFRSRLTDRSADPLSESNLTTLRREIDDAMGGQRFLPYVSAGLRMNF